MGCCCSITRCCMMAFCRCLQLIDKLLSRVAARRGEGGGVMSQQRASWFFGGGKLGELTAVYCTNTEVERRRGGHAEARHN